MTTHDWSFKEKVKDQWLNTHQFGYQLLTGDGDRVFDGWLRDKFDSSGKNYPFISRYSAVGFNFYRYVVDKISKIYDSDVVRQAGNDSPILERYSEVGFSAIMQDANFYANGLGFCLLHIGYKENEGLNYNLYTPNNFLYELDDDNELKKVDLIILRDEVGKKINRWVLEGDKVYYKRIVEIDGEEAVLESKELNYGVLPFVILNTKNDLNGKINIENNNDLYYASMDVYFYLTLLKMAVTKDTLKKPYIAGNIQANTLPDNISNDLFSIIKISSQDKVDIGYLTAQMDIGRLQDVVTNELIKLLSSFGISADKFSLSGSSSSGISIKLSNYGIIEERKKQLPIWQKHEKKIYQLSNTIAVSHGGKGDNTPLRIYFGELDLPKSQQEILKEEANDLANGTTSPVHILMQRYKVSEEEALVIYKKMKEYNEIGEVVETSD